MKMLKDNQIDFETIPKEKKERILTLLNLMKSQANPEEVLSSYKYMLKNKNLSEEEVKKVLKEDLMFIKSERDWKPRRPG